VDPGANLEVFRRVNPLSMLGFEPLITEHVGEIKIIYRNMVWRSELTKSACVD
jgi:hypothetical protein